MYVIDWNQSITSRQMVEVGQSYPLRPIPHMSVLQTPEERYASQPDSQHANIRITP